tara:strand:- start:20 stop:553 length:534 start_codon:yes stop_codon:yes gene_type:complete
MLKTLKKWKKFLLEGKSLTEYSEGDIVTLYHYSKMEKDKLLLDPSYFLSKRSSYSRRDYNVSAYPRVFFYVSLDEAEPIVASGKTPYSTTVPESEIYDLTKDPEDLRKRSISQYAVTPDVDVIMRALAGQPVSVDGEPLILNREYDGVYYHVQGMGVVAWFEPIVVNKIIETQGEEN